MSGLPPIATEMQTLLEVRFVPQPEIATFQRSGNGNKIGIALGLAPVCFTGCDPVARQRMAALAGDLAAATVA